MNGPIHVTLPQHWVAMRLGHLGDVVLTTGVLAALGKARGWSFSMLTKKAWAPVFAHNPFIREVIALEDAQLAARPFLAFSRQLADTCRHSGLLDLHGSLRSAILSLCWRGPVLRYAKMGLQRRLFLASGKRLHGDALRALSVPQRYHLAVDGPPPPGPALRPRIWLTEDEREEARARLRGLGLHAPVALHPYATHRLKAWPEGHWQALVRLLDRRGVPWLVLGKGAPLFPGDPRDLSNRTSLRESCALLAECRLLVSGDSGPMHLASAVGTPVVALFGPTTREWGFYPQGEQDRVLERDLPCRPCSLHGKKECPHGGACMASITPEQVMLTIEKHPAKGYDPAGSPVESPGKQNP